MSVITIDIAINDEGWPDEGRLQKLARDGVEATLARLGLQDAATELSVVFTSDSEIRSINNRWRHIDKATNVLSFPAFAIKAGQKPGPMLGDIILARETVEREAMEQGKPFHNHLTHLLVHGLLHLLGYDHENDEDAEIMERLERQIVHSLAIPDPYAVSLVD